MIFITVGTHEQPFNRLLEYVDRYIEENSLKEKIICQSGYSTYVPRNFKTSKFIGYKDMEKYMDEARIVITHGGPSSFIPILAKNKNVIIVPREKKYNEHVNNHQLDFCRKIANQNHSISLAETYKKFKDAITENQSKETPFLLNNTAFCKQLKKLMQEIV